MSAKRHGLLASLVVLGLGACSEAPAYELSWAVVDAATVRALELAESETIRAELESQGVFDPVVVENTIASRLAEEPFQSTLDDAASMLEHVVDCSRRGIARVRITTTGVSDDGEAVDAEQELACVPSTATYDGPKLPPGTYDIEVVGLRHNGEPWSCPDPDDALISRCIAQTQLQGVRLGDGTVTLPAVTLVSPFECDDGIDNDRDGQVDRSDLGCILDSFGVESADLGVTLFQATVTFLDNRNVRPKDVEVAWLRLLVDGELLVDIGANELDDSAWPFRLPLQSEPVAPGTHTFTLVALDASHAELATVPEVEFTVPESQTTLVSEHFDFTSDRFLEPIVAPFRIAFNRADSEGSPCELRGEVDGVPLKLDEYRIRVTDTELGQMLDTTTLGLSVAATDEPGGWVSFACPQAPVASAPLTWGSYSLEIQASLGGDTCFAHELDPDVSLLRPANVDPQIFAMDHVLVDGMAVGSCVECSGDGSRVCQETTDTCVGGLCIAN